MTIITKKFFVALLSTSMVVANFSYAASPAVVANSTYTFSFKDGQSLKVDKIGNKVFSFSLCGASGCEQLGRETGYSLRELNTAKLKHNFKRGGINTVVGSAVTCASLLGAGVGMAIPFGISAIIPIDVLSLVGMVISWEAMPITSMMGGMTALGYSSAIGGSIRDEVSPTSMEGAAEVLASVQPSERVSYWRQMRRWFSPALNQNPSQSESPSIVAFDVDEAVESSPVVESLSYLLNSIKN